MSSVSPRPGSAGFISLCFYSLVVCFFSTLPEAKVKKRRKKTVGPLSVTSMLKKFQREKEKGRQKLGRVQMVAPSSTRCPADAAGGGGGGGGSGLTDPLLSLIGSTNEQALIQAASVVDLDIDLDSLLEASEGTPVPQPAADPQLLLPKKDGFPQAPPPDPHVRLKPHSDPSVILPDGVPAGLAAAIERLTAVRRFVICRFYSESPTYADGVLSCVRLPGRRRGSQN